MKNILIWCVHLSQNINLEIFPIVVRNFLLAPYLSFFQARLFSLHYACHILSGCRKKPGNGTLMNFRDKGPFYHPFCAKTDNVVFKFASSERRSKSWYPKTTVARIDLF